MPPSHRARPRHAAATGAAGVAYVLLAAVENMDLLRAPGFGATAAELERAFADRTLALVTLIAGALSLPAFAGFVAGAAHGRRAVAAAGGAALVLAGGALVAGTQAIAGDVPAREWQLTLRLLAAPALAAFLWLAVADRDRRLAGSARALAVGLALTGPAAALARDDRLLALALGLFALQAVWVLVASLAWIVGDVRRGAFLLVALAAGVAGLALLAVPAATPAYFAWPLGPEPLAAWAGGAYAAAAAVYAAGVRAAPGAVRPLLAGAAVLAACVLAATLAHLDAFDFGRLQAWAWLALFAGFALTMAALLARASGPRPSGAPLDRPTRTLLAGAAAALGIVSVALWVAPGPLELPPLGARFAGAWVALLAVVCGWAAAEARRDAAVLPAAALVAFPAGTLVAGARVGALDPLLLGLAVAVAAAGIAALRGVSRVAA